MHADRNTYPGMDGLSITAGMWRVNGLDIAYIIRYYNRILLLEIMNVVSEVLYGSAHAVVRRERELDVYHDPRSR